MCKLIIFRLDLLVERILLISHFLECANLLPLHLVFLNDDIVISFKEFNQVIPLVPSRHSSWRNGFNGGATQGFQIVELLC